MINRAFSSTFVVICVVIALLFSGHYVQGFDRQTVNAASEEGRTLCVGEGQPYQSVRDAVYAANEGDTILVKSGTYLESFQIDKDNIIVKGEDSNTTFIGDNSSNPVISVCNTKGVTIEGLTIKSQKNCVSINNSDDFNITKCIIKAMVRGVKADKSSKRIFINGCDISGATSNIGLESGIGIESLAYSTNILNSKVYNNNIGIKISEGFEVIIENNRIYSNIHNGCELKDVSNFTCEKNSINLNSIGIECDLTSDNIITNGKIINNELFFNVNYSVVFSDVSNFLIENNYFHISNARSMGTGIEMLSSSNNNTITKNIISNYGLGRGVVLDYYSSGNKIYQNDFINSGARDNSDIQANNIWSEGKVGNYWSVYNGEDKNNDGIGDTPFVIVSVLEDIEPQDKYPLMKRQFDFVEPTQMPTPTPTARTTRKPTLTPTSEHTPTPTSTQTLVSSRVDNGVSRNTVTMPVVDIPAVNITVTPTATPPVTPSMTPSATHSATPSRIVENTPVIDNLPTDITKHWAKKYIDQVVSKGIMGGKGKGQFAPDDYTTRAECAKVTIELLKKVSKDIEMDKFRDVSKDDWYYNYVYSAYIEGIMIGNKNNKFLPNSHITRQDLALVFSKILTKYCSLEQVKALDGKENDLTTYNKGDISELKGKIQLPFDDTSSISKYALDGVATVSNYGLFTGKPGNKFDPIGRTTRAELATILYKLITKYKLSDN